MTQKDMGLFRKTLITIMSVSFTGVLLVYTGIANLNLLQTTYPDPQFVMFGMVALEGGVLYWTGYYLLHQHGAHKGIAVSLVVLDFLFSMIGFFLDINIHTGNVVRTALPPVVIIMAVDVAINVGMGILVHFLPSKVSVDSPTLPRNGERYYVNEEKHTTDQLKEGVTAIPFEANQEQYYMPVMLEKTAQTRNGPSLWSRASTAMEIMRGVVQVKQVPQEEQKASSVQQAITPEQESEQASTTA